MSFVITPPVGAFGFAFFFVLSYSNPAKSYPVGFGICFAPPRTSVNLATTPLSFYTSPLNDRRAAKEDSAALTIFLPGGSAFNFV